MVVKNGGPLKTPSTWPTCAQTPSPPRPPPVLAQGYPTTSTLNAGAGCYEGQITFTTPAGPFANAVYPRIMRWSPGTEHSEDDHWHSVNSMPMSERAPESRPGKTECIDANLTISSDQSITHSDFLQVVRTHRT